MRPSDQVRRIFYVPNEIGDALQSGYRRAFADLLSTQTLAEVEIFSLERRIRAGEPAPALRAQLVEAVQRFKPDLLFMQHVGATGLTFADITLLKDASARFLYQEADPYTRWVHPLPRASRIAGRLADVVFTVGAGVFTDNFARAGARRVEWTPSVFDPARIDLAPRTSDRALDVAVIANRGHARVRPLPSARSRVEFVGLLQERFSDRLGLWGRGWDGTGARGPLAYSDQSAALASAWISANWDHFAGEACYFSDRLAIALASGSIFATTLHPGYGAVFPASVTDRFLITGTSPNDLVQRIDVYLKRTSEDERCDAEEAARCFAWAHLRQDDHMVTMLNSAGASIDPIAAQEAWDLTRAPLEGG